MKSNLQEYYYTVRQFCFAIDGRFCIRRELTRRSLNVGGRQLLGRVLLLLLLLFVVVRRLGAGRGYVFKIDRVSRALFVMTHVAFLRRVTFANFAARQF